MVSLGGALHWGAVRLAGCSRLPCTQSLLTYSVFPFMRKPRHSSPSPALLPATASGDSAAAAGEA